jgi:PAS domain S-box-containing protein
LSDLPIPNKPTNRPISDLPVVELPELAHFFELSSDLMCILDAAGRCHRINPAFEQVLGYSSAEMANRLLVELAHEADRAANQAEIDRLLSGGTTARFINRYHRKHDGWRWLTWTLAAIDRSADSKADSKADPNSASRLLYCTARDVTEQLQIARQAQRDTEQAKAEMQLYATAVKNMQVGVQIWRLEDLEDIRSLQLIAINPAACGFIGLPAEEILGNSMIENFPALFETEVPTRYAEVVRTGESVYLGQVRYGDQRVKESTFEIRAFPLPNQCVGVAFEDVTTRNQEAAVRIDQAAQLKIIFDQAAVGMARLSPKGQWIQVNQRLCDMLGYSMPELLQKTFAEITHPDDVAADQSLYRQLVSGDLHQATLEKRYLTKQGDSLWTHVSASTVRDQQNALLYFIATIQDISQQKQTTLELRSQANDLLTVNRLLTGTMATLKRRNQELDQFAYVTSHDLKAPLRAIANLATWIEEDLGDQLPAENKEQFDLLKNRVHRMEGLINGLLEYSRIGRTHQSYELVEVGSLLSDIIDSLSPLGAFTVEVISPMPTIRTKRTPLNQVFSNLISNAIKHHDRANGRVQIFAVERDDFYEFAVVDDGPGIEPAYHDKVFAIFQTLKSRDDHESTGIGLSLVEKTVAAEGGKVTLESALGEGATFRFTWPKTPHTFS